MFGDDYYFSSSQNIGFHELFEGQKVDTCHSSLVRTSMRERTDQQLTVGM